MRAVGERPRQARQRKEARLGGVVARLEAAALDRSGEDEQDDGPVLSPARERAQEAQRADFEPGLLARLAAGGSPGILVALEVACGQAPVAHHRGVAPPDEQNLAALDHGDGDGGRGPPEPDLAAARAQAGRLERAAAGNTEPERRTGHVL